ncbi:MAG: histidine kinase dimerization/phospho-acceptor domain-containing protein [Gemmatimonadaceae bacterium]
MADRAAHEIRNPLNGLIVSVEVLRSRLTRGSVALQSLQPFAESAGMELQRVTPLVEALLSLARQPRTPVDLWTAMEPVLKLQAAVAAAHGGTVIAAAPAEPLPAHPGDALLARLACACALEAFTEAGTRVSCTVRHDASGVTLDFSGSALPAPPDATIMAALARAGIRVAGTAQTISVCFPATGPHTDRAT